MKEISPREKEIFDLLISEYIATAVPVGSHTLAKRGCLGLSSATIRGVLGRLEDLGLLTHPHTSAGRLPTTLGLRYYVNTIVGRRNLSEKEREVILEHLNSSRPEDVLKRAAAILSLISNYAGLIVMPWIDNIVLKHIEFIPLSGQRILGIFVARDGTVHNRVIDVGVEFTYPDFEKISNYCNSAFYGLTFKKAREKVLKELKKEQADYDRLTTSALLWSGQMFDEIGGAELIVEGESKLFSKFTDVEKVRQIVEALDEKKRLVHLLNRAIEAEEVCVFIGSESGYQAVEDCSIVTTAYRKDGGTIGTIGVIGPKSMDYSRIIPTVDFTARLVSQILEE